MKQTFVARSIALVCCLFVLVSTPTMAVEPDEILSDPKLEARAREVSLNLRCLVCQNQSIDDSNAELAKDLRVLVREFISKGMSNEQTTNEIVERYGEYVLLKPRMGLHTLILWLGPFALLLFAGGYLYMNFSSRPANAGREAPIAKPKALSSEEQDQLAKLMDQD